MTKYEALKNLYILGVSYPKGSLVELDDHISANFLDLGLIAEVVDKKKHAKT